MFEIPLHMVALAFVVVMMALTVQTIIGFGAALVAAPFLLMIDYRMVPAPLMMAALVQLVVSAKAHREDIQWSTIKMAVVGGIPGSFAGYLLVVNFGVDKLNLFIGISVLIAVLISLLKVRLALTPKNHFIAGCLSGLGGTISGIGGPPMALLYQHQTGNVVRANLSIFFLSGGIISLTAMGFAGYIHVSSLSYVVLFIPACYLGAKLGLVLKGYLKPGQLRPIILVLCSVSAIVVLLREG